MTILGTFTKQPAERESYSIDFGDDLEETDELVSATTVITPLGLTLVSSLVVGDRVKVLVLGGEVLAKYKLTVTATTNEGRVLQDEFIVKIKDF